MNFGLEILKVNISYGENLNSITVIGIGVFKILPNMSLETDNVNLGDFEEFTNTTIFILYEPNLNISNIKMIHYIKNNM